jgi:hypothetical protein
MNTVIRSIVHHRQHFETYNRLFVPQQKELECALCSSVFGQVPVPRFRNSDDDVRIPYASSI